MALQFREKAKVVFRAHS